MLSSFSTQPRSTACCAAEWQRLESERAGTDRITIAETVSAIMYRLAAHPRRGAHRDDEDWNVLAQEAWDSRNWKEAAGKYHRDRTGRVLIAAVEPERLKRLHDLLNTGTSFTQVYYAVNRRRTDGAPQPTVEALMLSLRESGVAALQEQYTRRRLCELGDDQVIEVGDKLQKLKLEIARAWSAEEVKLLLRARLK
jgi:DNA-binding transcriptional ArsR family regulator